MKAEKKNIRWECSHVDGDKTFGIGIGIDLADVGTLIHEQANATAPPLSPKRAR